MLLSYKMYNRVDIALITDINFTKYSHSSIFSYRLHKSNHPDGTTHDGVTILIKTNLEYYSSLNFSQNYIYTTHCYLN